MSERRASGVFSSTADAFDVPPETLQFPTMSGAFLIYRFPFVNNTGLTAVYYYKILPIAKTAIIYNIMNENICCKLRNMNNNNILVLQHYVSSPTYLLLHYPSRHSYHQPKKKNRQLFALPILIT